MTDAHANASALLALLPYGQWNADGGLEVVSALEHLGPAAVPALLEVLERPAAGSFVRTAAAWLLVRIGGGEAHAALARAAGDADEDVARAARAALTRSGPVLAA